MFYNLRDPEVLHHIPWESSYESRPEVTYFIQQNYSDMLTLGRVAYKKELRLIVFDSTFILVSHESPPPFRLLQSPFSDLKVYFSNFPSGINSLQLMLVCRS